MVQGSCRASTEEPRRFRDAYLRRRPAARIVGLSSQRDSVAAFPTGTPADRRRGACQHDEVAFIDAISGPHLMAIVVCRYSADFYRYLTERLAALPGVDGYSIRVRAQTQTSGIDGLQVRLVHPI